MVKYLIIGAFLFSNLAGFSQLRPITYDRPVIFNQPIALGADTIDSWDSIGHPYIIVDDVTARDTIYSKNRVEGLLVHVKNPYSWYQLVGGTANSDWLGLDIKRIASTGSDVYLYVASTGSDLTGDGTISNPYATYSRAIEDIPDINIAITVTIHNLFGSLAFTDADKASLGRKTYKSCFLTFTGEMAIVESGITFTEKVLNNMEYTASKAGLTIAENQYRGMYLADGAQYYPIPYNSAGTNTFDLTYLRGARNGTRSIVDNASTLDVSGQATDILNFNFPGINKITFINLEIDAGTNNIDFSLLQNFTEFDFATRIKCDQLIFGSSNDPSQVVFGLTGVVMESSNTGAAVDTYDGQVNINITRSYIQNVNNVSASDQVLKASKNSNIRLRECAIRGGGTCSGLSATRGAYFDLSKTNIFYDLNAVAGFEYGGGKLLNDLTQGYSRVLTRNTSYLTAYLEDDTQIYVGVLYTDGSYVGTFAAGLDEVYIDPGREIVIKVPNESQNFVFKDSVVTVMMPDTLVNKAYVDANIGSGGLAEIPYWNRVDTGQTFTGTIYLNSLKTNYNNYIVNNDFTINYVYNLAKGTTSSNVILLGNGVNVVDFGGATQKDLAFDNAANTANATCIWQQGGKVYYSIYDQYILDETPPVLQSAQVPETDKGIIELTFNEAVYISSDGWAINGDTITVASVANSGSATPSFILHYDTNKDSTYTLTYSSTSGTTSDLSGNYLVSLTDTSVAYNFTGEKLVSLPTRTNIDSTEFIFVSTTSDATGVSDQTLPGDFIYYYEFNSGFVNSGSATIGLDSLSNQEQQNGFKYGYYYVSTNDWRAVVDGNVISVSGEPPLLNGDYIGIRRVGTIVDIVHSTDAGATWDTYYTFAKISDKTLYMKVFMGPSGRGFYKLKTRQ